MNGCTCATCPIHAKTVACGACGARLPCISTKAQQQPDSPEFLARLKHVTEECPGGSTDIRSPKTDQSEGGE